VPAALLTPPRNPAFLNRHIHIIFTPPLTTEIYVEGNYTDTKEAIQLLEMEKLEKSS
jgi:hypothetical protein